MAIAVERDPAETLAWEARQRPFAGIAAILSGLLLLISNVIGAITLKDQPTSTVADGLRDALGQPLSSGEPGLLTPEVRYVSHHAGGLYLQSALAGIGTLLIAVVLGYLYRATEARRPIPRPTIILALLGPITTAVAPLISRIGIDRQATKYLKGTLSTSGAHDVFTNSLATAGSVLLLFSLVTAAAFVLISLNAMRAGLLTRFLGIMGIIVGVLLIFTLQQGTIASPIIVQVFWLIAIGFVILQRLPTIPPAWTTGVAVPWPSRQDVIDSQSAARGKGADDEEEDIGEDGPSPVQARPQGSAKRKKRKRR